MGANNDDAEGPDAAIAVEIGATGVAIFGTLLLLTLFATATARNVYSRRLFASSTLMSACELPRYIALILDKTYNCQPTYALHMVGSFFFFLSFSFVCYLLHDAVDLSHTTSPLANTLQPAGFAERLVLDKQFLISMNGLFAALVIAVSVICLLYSSLLAFFETSIMYLIFTIVDAVKNIIFGATIIYYGQRLRSRIKRFATNSATFESPSEAELIKKLRAAVRKLLLVMVICNLCFWLRAGMLLLKALFVELNGEKAHSMSWLPVYGLLWWWLSDFAPRALPVLVIVAFFSRTGDRQKGVESVSKSSSSMNQYRYRRTLVEVDDTDSNSQAGRDNSDESSSSLTNIDPTNSANSMSPVVDSNSNGMEQNTSSPGKTSYNFRLQAFLIGLLRGRDNIGSDEVGSDSPFSSRDELRQRLLKENDEAISSSATTGNNTNHSPVCGEDGEEDSPEGQQQCRRGEEYFGGRGGSMNSNDSNDAIKGTPMVLPGDEKIPTSARLQANTDLYYHQMQQHQHHKQQHQHFLQHHQQPQQPYYLQQQQQQQHSSDWFGGADCEVERKGSLSSGGNYDIEQSFGFDGNSYRSTTTDGQQSLFTDAATSALYSDSASLNASGISFAQAQGRQPGSRYGANPNSNNIMNTTGSKNTAAAASSKSAIPTAATTATAVKSETMHPRKISFGGDSSTQSVVLAKHAVLWPPSPGQRFGAAHYSNNSGDVSDTESDV